LERKEKNKQYTALTVRRDFTSQGRKKNNLKKQKSEGNAILLIFSSWPEAWFKLKFLITKENKVRNVLNGRENFPTFPEIRYPGWQKQHFPNLANRKGRLRGEANRHDVPNLFWLSSEAVLTSRSFLKGKANFY
jgi:hypothetical protein